jgi:uncharacterized metal-binding protein
MLESCPACKADREEVLAFYHVEPQQQVVQAAAELVDGGRAGTLSRLEELIAFAHVMNYLRLGLAYCYGMESDARKVVELLREAGLRVVPVCCTTGALAQREVNIKSELPGVSCNPAAQAAQLNAEGVDLVITMGLCLGHDILLQQRLKAPSTNLVVKDRSNGHNSLAAIRDQHARTR